eukprot:334949-Pleurochrysis_carterae.AAC.1
MACPNRTFNGDQFSYTVPPGPPWVLQLHHVNYRIYYRTAARDRTRSELVSFRPGGRVEPTIIHKIRPSGGWELARPLELGRAYAVAPGRWLEGAAAAITREFSRAERERSANTHAMRCKNGEPC